MYLGLKREIEGKAWRRKKRGIGEARKQWKKCQEWKPLSEKEKQKQWLCLLTLY